MGPLNAEEMARRLAELDAALKAQHQRLGEIEEEARVLREAITTAKHQFHEAKKKNRQQNLDAARGHGHKSSPAHGTAR